MGLNLAEVGKYLESEGDSEGGGDSFAIKNFHRAGEQDCGYQVGLDRGGKSPKGRRVGADR
jgi:hypothetical protein